MKLSVLTLLLVLAACTSPQTTIHAAGQTCTGCEKSAIVLWGTAWRSNQKEPELRGRIAEGALQKFFQKSVCFRGRQIPVETHAGDRLAATLTDTDLIAFAKHRGRDRVILIRLEELGPLIILRPSLVLWEGGSEVQLRIRVLNAAASTLDADVSVHRRDTGPFVLRGTGNLEHDVLEALGTVFGPDCSVME